MHMDYFLIFIPRVAYSIARFVPVVQNPFHHDFSIAQAPFPWQPNALQLLHSINNDQNHSIKVSLLPPFFVLPRA